MTLKLKLFFVIFCIAHSIFLCEAQEKKKNMVPPQPAAPQEEQIEVDGMLLTKDGKTLIKPKSSWLQTVTIPDQVRIIRGGAFRSNPRLQSVEIPDSVEEIGEGAFWHCNNLKQITIPRNVKKIGGKALLGIDEVILDPEQKTFVIDDNGVLIDQKEKILLRVPQHLSGTYEVPAEIKTISGGAFYGCSRLIKVVIPDSVEMIGADAFNKCRNLREIILPEGLKIIEHQAFAYCQNLQAVDLPDTVEEIHSKAFFGCINLTKLKLSKSLKTVKKKAFDNCKNLQTIIEPQTISYKTLSSWRIPGRKIIRPKD